MARVERPGAHIPGGAWVVVMAGVAAALHLGKLPPAVPALQVALGITLVQAGFLLSLVQVAGMTLGLLAGLAADTIGLRRSMLIGLVVLTLASVAGGFVGSTPHALEWLLGLRALEGLGFLLTVMPAPGLIRAQTTPGTEKAALGLWGAYMPLGVALALLIGPAAIGAAGWPAWWWGAAAVSALAAGAVFIAVRVDAPRAPHAPDAPPSGNATVGDAQSVAPAARLRATLTAPGPWAAALAFAVYSSQWMAVIGFLPSIYAGAGVPAGATAVLTALAAAMNIVGNVMGGRLLQRGVEPARLLRWGFSAMGVGAVAAFAQWGDAGLSPTLRYLAICLFSLCGGMVPATLFLLGVRLAPGPSTVSTSIGLLQQLSSLGQFVAPPVVAWVAHRVGGWQWTWAVTGACSLAGIVLASRLGRLSRLARQSPMEARTA